MSAGNRTNWRGVWTQWLCLLPTGRQAGRLDQNANGLNQIVGRIRCPVSLLAQRKKRWPGFQNLRGRIKTE